MNSTIYAALNQCSTTGLEQQIAYMECPDGKRVRLYKDHKEWHRIALFESDAPDSGISGVIVQPDGEVYYKQTAPHAQGNGHTRALQAMLAIWGVHWYRSELLTESGAACYKIK
ncbi:hypothetical protein psageK4_171 [Pseudomonas phage psageK4]|uniref:Uncharacterized protein n=1 Tax=Pseudomonas phage psageK4 TaxID=2859563 RepID=A0ABX8SMK0_9CAUD|nr:hypothetical protein QGX14_gp064 [Pseudomonas phage psageK4]QXV71825.1 hypothetical protein psageK4_171 [Pseudomonas phage psageK4]